MDEINKIEQPLDRMEQRIDQIIRLVEQLVQMVVENNHGVADLRSVMSGMEDRLTARVATLEEQLNRDLALWQAEIRHFAQALDVLERFVAVL